MSYDRLNEMLDPRFPGEWLAAVGLSCFGPGRWRRYEDSSTGWYYEHDGDLPEVWRLQDHLHQLDVVPEDPIWLCFAARGLHNRAIAGRRLAEALEGVDVNDLRQQRHARPHTAAASSWMIDETWRRHPGMGLSQDHPTPVPVIEASLALIAAYSDLLYRVSTWVTRRVAIGWIWETSITPTLDDDFQTVRPEPPLDSHIMGWRRMPRIGEPHTGALGLGKELTLSAPTWRRWVPIEVNGPPALGEAAARYLSRTPTDTDPVGLRDVAKLLGLNLKEATALLTRGGLPPPRWMIDEKPAWSLSADIEPWVDLNNLRKDPSA